MLSLLLLFNTVNDQMILYEVKSIIKREKKRFDWNISHFERQINNINSIPLKKRVLIGTFATLKDRSIILIQNSIDLIVFYRSNHQRRWMIFNEDVEKYKCQRFWQIPLSRILTNTIVKDFDKYHCQRFLQIPLSMLTNNIVKEVHQTLRMTASR